VFQLLPRPPQSLSRQPEKRPPLDAVDAASDAPTVLTYPPQQRPLLALVIPLHAHLDISAAQRSAQKESDCHGDEDARAGILPDKSQGTIDQFAGRGLAESFEPIGGLAAHTAVQLPCTAQLFLCAPHGLFCILDSAVLAWGNGFLGESIVRWIWLGDVWGLAHLRFLQESCFFR